MRPLSRKVRLAAAAVIADNHKASQILKGLPITIQHNQLRFCRDGAGTDIPFLQRTTIEQIHPPPQHVIQSMLLMNMSILLIVMRAWALEGMSEKVYLFLQRRRENTNYNPRIGRALVPFVGCPKEQVQVPRKKFILITLPDFLQRQIFVSLCSL